MSLGNDLIIKHIEGCDYCIVISESLEDIFKKLKNENDDEIRKLLNETIDFLNKKAELCFTNSMI